MERRENSELRVRIDGIVVLVETEMVPWQIAGDSLERAGAGDHVIRRVLTPYTRIQVIDRTLSSQLGFPAVPRWLKQ